MTADGYTYERIIETPSSSSNIVVRGASFGMEITLDPMVQPVRRIDIYDEEAEQFAEAVQEAAAEVDDA